MNRIKELRKQQKITQAQLGKKCSVSSAAVSLWELEERDIPVKHLKTLSRLFNCSIDYLLANDNENRLERKFCPIEPIYNQLNKDKQEQLLDFAHFLLDQQNTKKDGESLCA